MERPEPAILTPEQLRELREANPRVRLIDVRTPGEFAGAHIPGSRNVPLDLLREHRGELGAEHGDPVVLVCRSGLRADQARRLVAGTGLGHVSVLQGGISGWEGAGAPVERGEGGRWAMERQVRLAAGTIVLAAILASTAFNPLKWVAAAVGAGLVAAAVTNTCAMARVLSLLPRNRADACDAPALLAALTDPEPTARS